MNLNDRLTRPAGRPYNPFAIRVFVLLAAVIGLHLVLIQLDLVTLSEKVPIYTSWPDAAAFLSWVQGVKAQIVDFYFNTYFLSLIILIALVLFLHFTSDIINQFLDWAFENRKRTIIFLVILFATLLRYYLSPGPLTESGDSCGHLNYAWLCRFALAHGEAPTWSNWDHCGAPLLQDYGPVGSYAFALVNLAVSDFTASVKLTLFLAHLASGLAFFYMAAHVAGNRKIALLCAMIYALIGWHSHSVLVNGRYPVAFIFIFMPLVFLETWRLMESTGLSLKKSLPSAIKLAFYGALLYLTHFLYAFFQFGIFLALFIIVRAAPSFRDPAQKASLRPMVVKLAISLGLFLILTGAFTFPVLLEKGESMAGTVLGHDVSMGNMGRTFNIGSWFIWSNNRFPLFSYKGRTWMDTYYGLSTFALLLFFIFTRLRSGMRFSQGFKGLAASALAVFIVILFWGLWPSLPILKLFYTTAAYRYQVPLVFFLCTLSAVGLRDMERTGVFATKKGFINSFTPFALALVLVDLGSLTFQTPYGLNTEWDQYKQTAGIFKKQLEDSGRAIPNERVYYEGMGVYDFEIKGASLCVRRAYHPSYQGTFNPGAPLSWLYTRSVYPLLRDAFEAKDTIAVDRRMANFFYLTNTRLLLLRPGKTVPPQPFVESVDVIPGEKTVARMAFGSPIVFSTRLEKAMEQPSDTLFAKWLWDHYDIDFGTGRGAAIFVKPGDSLGGTDLGGAPAVSLDRFVTEGKTVTVKITTDAPVFVRLPFSFHHSVKITVNGLPVEPIREALEFICLRLAPGENEIVLKGGLSGLRKVLLLIGLAAFAAMLGTLVVLRRRGKNGDA